MDDARAIRICLTPIAPRSDTVHVSDALNELGYVVELSHPTALRIPVGDVPIVLLVDASQAGEARRLLARLNYPASLAVLSSRDRDWESDFLDRCTEFVGWPCHPREMKLRMQRVCRAAGLLRDPVADLDDDFAHFNLIGESPQFKRVLRQLTRMARCDAPVLLQGETGTGKELAARAIHYQGARQDYPFVAVNCGALPDELIENEFFGHEKGAYTDAKHAHQGLISQADGGALFLDEVDALSAKGQVTLLRFLEEQSYRPLGGVGQCQANVRIMSACNRNLVELTERALFRADLLFRINLLTLDIPPLRARTGDVELLAGHFLAIYRQQYRQPDRRLDARSLQWMADYAWPGNVRELESMIHRQFLLTDNAVVSIFEDTARGDGASAETANAGAAVDRFRDAKARAIEKFEKQYLRDLMTRCQGNVSQAARIAGKERRALGRLLQKHQIERSDFI